MVLPQITTPPISQNARVPNFAIGGDESPRQSAQSSGRSSVSIDELIEQAYRQIYFHAFKVDRDSSLDSQLRSGQINVRDFARSLLLSSKFRDDFYRCNSNYRMVEQIVGRVLGRAVHGEKERIALSILIAQQGLVGLIDHLLDSPEYLNAFGYDMVPFQRGLVLAGQAKGTQPFNLQAPRYEGYWREATSRRAPAGRGTAWSPASGLSLPRPAWLADAPSPQARRIWQGMVTAGGFVLTGLVLYVAATMLSTAGAG